MSKKILTVVGARPQFIKAAAVSRVIRAEYAGRIDEVLIHTGQHYDANMSQVFFDELDIPRPKFNLEISGGSHGAMTGRMLEAIEKVILSERPDWMLLYGDTNSTLAGALAASKLHIPIAHVESGLRSFNFVIPEEVNRVLVDRISTLLLCPTETAVRNLAKEGLLAGVSNSGDVTYDVALYYRSRCNQDSVLGKYRLSAKHYVLATCHRAENTNDAHRLSQICKGLSRIASEIPVLFPLHPRTRETLNKAGLLEMLGNVSLVEPLSFMEMIALEQASLAIVTDSGGVQKEAFFYGVPCVTMRDETEWVETLDFGWNKLVGADADAIANSVLSAKIPDRRSSPFGDGDASSKVVSVLNDA